MEGNRGICNNNNNNNMLKLDASPVVSMLHERERRGINGNRDSFLERLSSQAAWNRRRIRDMALVVGPNSPAAFESSTATSLLRASSGLHEQDDNEYSFFFDDSAFYEQQQQHEQRKGGLRPAMRSAMQHKGCINTASWLTEGWKLSYSKKSMNSQPDNDIFKGPISALLTDECTTQLMTSGDDRTVLFWDVSGAMGSTSLPTEYPHLTTLPAFFYPSQDDDDYETWDMGLTRRTRDLSGSVVPLGVLPTSHRGNIFHVAPVPYQPGLVSTCAADGSLQLGDIERALGPSLSSSPAAEAYTTIVVSSPEFMGSSDEQHQYQHSLGWSFRSPSSSMAFSHCFLDRHVGLLCSERGLHKFDLRLSPREQPRQNLFALPRNNHSNSNSDSCKACVPWNQHRHHPHGQQQPTLLDENVTTCYVFAGGTSGVVGLYDLRMDSGSETASSRILQTYLPSTLQNSARNSVANTSVSGLGVSKDGTELLVSYDCDQIYTFDVTPNSKHPGEKAMYGGHLNRLTFLKEAKYAGPRDEYICTGSDSGHAWIYDRDSGSVAALFKADRSTCNAIIPHPTLPLFITYGIDSTAKLWRGISNDTASTTTGASRSKKYANSASVSQWKAVQRRLSLFPEVDEKDIPVGCLPDSIHYGLLRDEYETSTSAEAADDFLFPFIRSRMGNGSNKQLELMGGSPIANSLKHLPELLQLNYDTCFREVASGKAGVSVQSGLIALARNVSVARLRHQADRLGLRWNKEGAPWIMELHERQASSDKLQHPADLVPDFPMDWMPYDLELTPDPKKCRREFEKTCDFGYDTSGKIYDKPWLRLPSSAKSDDFSREEKEEKSGEKSEEQSDGKEPKDITSSNAPCPKHTTDAAGTASANQEYRYSEDRALEILLQTILILKDGGNKALEAGFPILAAQRYEKALSYCSLLFLTFAVGNLYFLDAQHAALLASNVTTLEWTPLHKALVTIRLNLSMTMQQPEIADWDAAMAQARSALQELKPFSVSPGRAVCSKSGINNKEEMKVPESVYHEAKELQAKAFFRLGTAQYSSKNYSGAVSSFEMSIQSTKESKPGGKPDAIVLRRLADARRDKAKKQERVRKRYKNSLLEGGI